MNIIKWTKNGSYGIDGRVSQRELPMFKIYLPGDPCNFGQKGQFELLEYAEVGYRIKLTYHPTLKAAKDAARRAYYRAYGLKPQRRVVFKWVPGWYDGDEYLKDGDDKYRYFVGENFWNNPGHSVTINSGHEILGVFPTRGEAKCFAEKLLREAGND